MDSCSSSPSHSFKDRPHSRHGDLSRQPSFPHNLDRAKSPAPKAVSENRGLASRDLARRSGSYGACVSEKDGGDSLLSSPERSRSFLRKPFGFDRTERHGDSKTELHRSTRVHTPSRNSDRDSVDMGVRVPSRRSSHGGDGHRHEGSEGVSSSSLQGGAFKRGYERESGEIKQRASKSPEFDDEASRSPVSGKGVSFNRNDGKDLLKGPLRTSLGGASKRDLCGEARTPRTSPVKEGWEKGKLASLIKASGKERLDEMDVTSSKTKLSVVKEKEMQKEQEANSGETETKARNITTKSRNGGGDDAVEGEQWLKADDLHDDEKSMSFLHISKRARSDRDRGRRDEHSTKASVQQSQENKDVMNKECFMDRLGSNGSVSKTDGIDAESGARYETRHNEEFCASGADSGAIHADERSSEKMEIECPVSNSGHNSDMEEGELEPESHAEPGKAGSREAKAAASKEREEVEKQQHVVVSQASKGKEGCDSVLRVVAGEEKILNGNGEERHRSVDDVDEDHDSKDVKMLSPDRTENCGVSVDLEFTVKSALVSSTKVSELGESSRTGLVFDLLGTRTEAKSLSSLPADKGLGTNRELTLSLFTQSSEVEAPLLPEADVQVKGSNGKQIEGLHDLETGSARPHVGRSGEESSQHSGHKQKKLKMESLQLSLALPGTSNMVAGTDLPRMHADPERNLQSLSHTQTQTQNPVQSQTYTNSDGFTTSFSFSQSESFIHNPSCSLNCTSLENQELSCGGSKQFSQGTEQMSNRSWPALSGNDGMHTVTSLSQDKSKHRRGIPLYQRVLQNGSMHQGFSSVTGSNRSSGSNHVPQRSHHLGQRLQDAPKILDSSSQDLEGSGRHINTHKDIMERVRQQKAWFASKQQAMSGEPRSEPNASQSRDRSAPADSPAFNLKGPSSAGNDTLAGERNVSSERVGLQEITTEPIAAMAQKLQELPDSFLEGLKGVAKGVVGSFEKREEFIALQDNIRRRTDLTEDSLLRAHRTQLEILVALKTGIQAFVQEGSKPQTYKALIEIFLQTRCRNVACQQLLPVCGCECRICSKKSGFCHECMCVVCFKFDSDNNTCRWVGCDLCLHWCHTDCGLRMSHITPTPAAKNSSGSTEMQYRCVACDHKSELFGFVKEVFHKCAETWGAETLAKELDCVRRIFHGSEDMRGKQLCWKAEQMLQKLETKVDAAEVCRSMLRFFQEGNAELDGASGPNKKSSSSKADASPSHAADIAPKTTSGGGGGSGSGRLVDLDNARAMLHNFDKKSEEKRTEASELQYERARKRAEIEDIESVVRIRQAEAKMFQARADEARQEAGGLQRIIAVKREKIDEDYTCKYAKLRLSEAEERQRKRLEELHALESAQQDFQKMKNRMEAEIKELMMKMEVAKRQFA